ncbi:hypothetical protein GIB67_014111 [Kingdonia uniflora]|uniref:RRM domain-containing protein n=1 Tax=Kingdonia uniflora TaxID=39325 RepID=A0A7J7N3Y3_9MAGN|nr:hypothetical protein GIB67_014111 [Kingdonia uniflora]
METDRGKLFIGGISWDTNEERLKEYFENYGEVVEAVIMKDRTTGRARGFGFVIYADPAIAERVLMDKHVIDGRTVEAKKAVPREDQHILNRSSITSIQGSPGPARTKKIFVGGLASTVTESDFKMYFDQFGMITDVVVMYDHNTQRPRGFGFITFDSEEAVEKVLLKTFHELNGKMVEVKRAVPKELSPGPSRSLLGGYNNYGLTRVNNFINGYTHGFNPTSVGGFGVRMDGRYSQSPISRNGLSPFSPSPYGMGVNFETGLSPSYGIGRGLNPYYNGSPNRYGSPVGFGVGSNGGTGSLLSPNTRSVWGNGGLDYAANSASSNGYMSSGNGNIGGNGFGNIGANWASSPISPQSANLRFGSGDSSYGLGRGGYGRSSSISGIGSMASYGALNSGRDGAYGDFSGGGSVYGDTTWRSASSELDLSTSLGYGFLDATSDAIPTKNSAGYVGGYTVSDRQSNRGVITVAFRTGNWI